MFMQLVLPHGWYNRHPELDEPAHFEAGSPEPEKEEDQTSSATEQ